MITVSITNARHLAAIDAACAVDNAARLATGNPALAQRTAQQYVQSMVDVAAETWAEVHAIGSIPVAAFVRRFPGSVMDAVNASTDPNVAAILAQLNAVQTVQLWHPTTTQGVAYLVSAGLLTQGQADVVLAW